MFMLQTRIKICGITSAEDARLAERLGADYLGVIFADGVRRVEPETAMAIREAVPAAMLIGVFADAPVKDVVSLARASRLNMIQLHGNEDPDYCNKLQAHVMLPIIKAFRPRELTNLDLLRHYTRMSYFMLDLDKNERPEQPHVNGRREELWEKAAMIRNKGYRVFLAGGLNPDNVRHAIYRVLPYGIDVASGVEKRPGVKDLETLGRFVEEARR
jgi:phosphoribosylanthranilate isomerase